MLFRDYEEFIDELNAHGVRYLIIGAHAVALYARPRATKDLDILLDPSPQNAKKVLAALRDFFGGADIGYSIEDLTNPDWIIQLGVAPVRIDLMFTLPNNLNFKKIWNNRVEKRFGTVKAYYIGFNDLIRAKKASGRIQDRADIQVLQKVRRHR